MEEKYSLNIPLYSEHLSSTFFLDFLLKLASRITEKELNSL